MILVGDPGRVALVASHFESKECEVESREFRTVTGLYQGKRITVLSTGIGCDNIDIVMNELDALANIDFATRTDRPEHRTLELVRIGTCGGLQPFTPEGTFVASERSIGFDGLPGEALLLPLMMFNFFFYMWNISLGFFDAVVDIVTGRGVKWDKTIRFAVKEGAAK